MEIRKNSSSSQSKNVKLTTGGHRLMGVEDLVTSQGIEKSNADDYGTQKDVEAILNGGNSQIYSTTQSNSNIKDLSQSSTKRHSGQSYNRNGDQFHSGGNNTQMPTHKSILKSSKCFQDEQLSSGIRMDSHGSPIKRRVSQEDKPLHKITFGNKIEEVNIVENWKAYNIDESSEPTCGCNVF